MQNLSNIGVIRDVLSRHGFTFSKALGQNFLINPSVCPRMAQAAHAGAGWGIIEIGAGIGVLTRELCARADQVVCIEIDKRLRPILQETLDGCTNLKIIFEDVLKVDLAALIEEEFKGKPVAVAANLPYYITSPILMQLLESRLAIESVTVMVQKEAAARLCAAPGSRAVGAVSFAVQYFSEPEILFNVSRGSFMPAPEVDSCVIRLNLRKEPPVRVRSEKAFFKVVKAAFAQRRKTLPNTLSSSLNLPKSQVAACIAACGLPATARAEELSLDAFALLADALFAQSPAQ